MAGDNISKDSLSTLVSGRESAKEDRLNGTEMEDGTVLSFDDRRDDLPSFLIVLLFRLPLVLMRLLKSVMVPMLPCEELGSQPKYELTARYETMSGPDTTTHCFSAGRLLIVVRNSRFVLRFLN
jgi:hypothetical protein